MKYAIGTINCAPLSNQFRIRPVLTTYENPFQHYWDARQDRLLTNTKNPGFNATTDIIFNRFYPQTKEGESDCDRHIMLTIFSKLTRALGTEFCSKPRVMVVHCTATINNCCAKSSKPGANIGITSMNPSVPTMRAELSRSVHIDTKKWAIAPSSYCRMIAVVWSTPAKTSAKCTRPYWSFLAPEPSHK